MNTMPCVKDASVISSFCGNVRNQRMREKLSTHSIETTLDLWKLADKCARMEEGRMLPGETQP